MKEVYFDTNVYDLLDELLQTKAFAPVDKLKNAIQSEHVCVYTSVLAEHCVDTAGGSGSSRPGTADLKPMILKRDGYTCQMCGRSVTLKTSQMDHIKPVRRFKRPVDANHPDNLWTLCIEQCHPEKTKHDRQMESRMQ
jgi:5-methylcytosine-specific restriction endonuclease McrA